MVIQQPQHTTEANPTTWTGYDWSCRINGAPVADPTVALTVNNGSHPGGVDLLDGQTVLIGSTAYGNWDAAIAYVRGDQHVDDTTVTLNISTSSEMRGHVLNGYYLVALDEFRFRQRYGRIMIVGGVVIWYKDYDIEWDDLGGGDPARRLAMMPPVPIMGPHAVKFVEIGTDAAQFYFDWSNSYAPAVAETVSGWDSWGETDHAGGTWTYNADATPGWQTTDAISGLRGFRVVLEVDDGNGNATTLPYRRGVRYVFTLRRPGETQVGDPENAEPITDFALNEPVSGSFDRGYWRTSVTVFEGEASKYNIMPEALVVLFTEDRYTDDCSPSTDSLGPISDRENILLVGRIVDGSIRKNPETGDVTFDVASPGAEAAAYHNYPIVIQNDDAGTSWIDTPDLTVDRAVHYYTTWHTTMNLVADVYQTGSTIEIYAQDFLEGDIYSTLDRFLYDRLFARLLCDKYGRFFCEIDAQETAFGTAPTLWAMEQEDWLDEVTVRQFSQARVNAAECGGLIYAAGTVTPKLSRAPGLFDKYRGARQQANSLAIVSQNALNTTCGRHLSALNYEFEIDFQLAGNWRYCDIAPQRVADIGTLATDRETLTGDYIIRAVSNAFLPDEGVIFTDIQTEQEADDGVAGVTIVIPGEMPDVSYIPEYPEGFGGVEPLGGKAPQEPMDEDGQWYASRGYWHTNGYYIDATGATTPPYIPSFVWNSVAQGQPIEKTCLMPSATTPRFYGYGYIYTFTYDDGIHEYAPLPFDTGAWSTLYDELDIATLLGHSGDYDKVYLSRMQFSIKPNQEGWGWCVGQMEYTDAGTEHMVLFCLHTRNGWDGIVYATEIADLEEGVDYDTSVPPGWHSGMALEMHSDKVYIAWCLQPYSDDNIGPTMDGWWRLYRSQDFGQTFALAQSETYTWGVDGYFDFSSELAHCDVWVPWVSNSYSGGAAFWSVAMMTINQNDDDPYVTQVYRSLNHGLSYEDIGDDGGDLVGAVTFLGGPYNSLDRVYAGCSTVDQGVVAPKAAVYVWIDGSGWTLWSGDIGAVWGAFARQNWVVMAMSGYALVRGLGFREPLYVNESATGVGFAPAHNQVTWMTYVP